MKIVVITQEDKFVIPKNLLELVNLSGVSVDAVFVIDTGNSLDNKRGLFVRGFGLIQAGKMFCALLHKNISCWLSSVSRGLILRRHQTIKQICYRNSIEYRIAHDINDQSVLSGIRSMSPDIIISYSAPSVFQPELLSIPVIGCINLHCSLLPSFAGVMPSFWVLYKRADVAGCSVHLMDDKIDNGRVLAQETVVVSERESMFSLIHRTKERGGQLMCRVVCMLRDNTPLSDIVCDNSVYAESYYTWPTVSQLKDFRGKGGKLI